MSATALFRALCELFEAVPAPAVMTSAFAILMVMALVSRIAERVLEDRGKDG